MNIDDIKSNHKYQCARCNDPITLENYSGWEAFVSDGKTTQPICKFCDLVANAGGEIAKEDQHKQEK